MWECGSCGCKNPDEGNYCANCGNVRIGKYGIKLYQIVVNKSQYDQLVSSKNNLSRENMRLKKELEGTVGYKVKKIWKNLKGDDSTSETIGGIFVVIAIVGWLGSFIFTWCMTKKLAVQEVNGKYGIGYNNEELLVKAMYDSISSKPIGNHWKLYDKKKNLIGVAYVTDSVQRVVEPAYTDVRKVGNDVAILGKQDENGSEYNLFVQGILKNKQPYKKIEYPSYSIDDAKVFVAEKKDKKEVLLDKYGNVISPDYDYFRIKGDSVILAKKTSDKYPYIRYELYDYDGAKLKIGEICDISSFSDKVAWAMLSESDYRNDVYSVIDNKGNVLFKRKSKYRGVENFSEGIGWWKSQSGSTDKWTAVDKSGKDLFEIEAKNLIVYPYTMGVAPVEKGSSYKDSKLGFVDKQGKTIIPFVYTKASSYLLYFDKDSLMLVSKDGVKGKLHRNGTFTPNK